MSAATETLGQEALEALFDEAIVGDAPALRGHRLTRRHGRRAAQAELRDTSRRRVVAASSGVRIPFEDGHARQLPVLTEAPFRYATKTFGYLDAARGKTKAAG